MDLFSIGREGDRDSRLLADRMRPSSLDEYIGQEHIIGPEAFHIIGKRLKSLIWGECDDDSQKIRTQIV